MTAAIVEEPSTSVCKRAHDHGMVETSMREFVKLDLGVKSLSKQKVQLLTPAEQAKRVEHEKKIQVFLKCGLDAKVLFSD